MSDPANQIRSDDQPVTAAETPREDEVPVRLTVSSCPSCQFTLAGRSHLARFCPQCGAALSRGDCSPADFVPFARRADAVKAAISDWLMLRGRSAEKGDPLGPLTFRHSLMLLGYANAMYRLGWRYETGDGTGRNVDEAVRCYYKAAKLGNPAALSRLAPQCVQEGPSIAGPAGAE